MARAGELLTKAEIDLARAQIRDLARVRQPLTVPCHLDNQPRNWLVDASGTVRMIDFGQADRSVWIQDVGRMYFRHWPGNPDRRDAFFSGDGRVPDAEDWQVLKSYTAYSGLSTVVWAHEHGDPECAREGHAMLHSLTADWGADCGQS